MSEENGELIGEVKSGGIHISISTFNNVKYLDIRKYFRDDNGEMKPTKKGIALNKAQFQEVLSVLNAKKDEIEGKL